MNFGEYFPDRASLSSSVIKKHFQRLHAPVIETLITIVQHQRDGRDSITYYSERMDRFNNLQIKISRIFLSRSVLFFP